MFDFDVITGPNTAAQPEPPPKAPDAAPIVPPHEPAANEDLSPPAMAMHRRNAHT